MAWFGLEIEVWLTIATVVLSVFSIIIAICSAQSTAKSHKQEMINEYKARKGQQRFHLPHEMRESYIREETLRRNIESK